MQKYLELYISVTSHPWNKRANSRKEAWNLLNYKWSKANPVSSFVIHTSSACEIVGSAPFPLNSKIGLHMLTVQAVRSVGGQGYPGGQGSTCFEDLCAAFHGRDWTPDHKFNEFFFEGCGAKVKIQALESRPHPIWSFEVSPSIFLEPSLMPQVKNDIKPDGIAVQAVWVKRESPRKKRKGKFKCWRVRI